MFEKEMIENFGKKIYELCFEYTRPTYYYNKIVCYSNYPHTLFYLDELNKIIDELFDTSKEKVDILTEKETNIIRLRNGFTNGEIYTSKEIAKLYNLSQTRIYAIEKRALEKIAFKFKRMLYRTARLLYSSINTLDLSENVKTKLDPSNNIQKRSYELKMNIDWLCNFTKQDFQKKGLTKEEINEIITKLHLLGLKLSEESREKQPFSSKAEESLFIFIKENIYDFAILKLSGINTIYDLYNFNEESLQNVKNEKYRQTIRRYQQLFESFLREFNMDERKATSSIILTILSPIEDLNLSARIYSRFKRAKFAIYGKRATINSIYDLTQLTENDILGIIDLGENSLQEIIYKLNLKGLSLSDKRTNNIHRETTVKYAEEPKNTNVHFFKTENYAQCYKKLLQEKEELLKQKEELDEKINKVLVHLEGEKTNVRRKK